MSKLFSLVHGGRYDLSNPIVMALMTRKYAQLGGMLGS